MRYISNTPPEKEEMLQAIGVEEVTDLFQAIPEEVKFERPFDIPAGLSELELKNLVTDKAEQNLDLSNFSSYLGAGSYDHYIPAIIDHMIVRSEFYTAYTPYQAELSQGTLQAMYEYQSMICELTGMGISNASLLDGASALGEAVIMARRHTRKEKVLLPETLHPSYREVAKTYGEPHGIDFKAIEQEGTVTDYASLAEEIDDDTAAVVIQYPNFYGSIEDMKKIAAEIDRAAKALLIVVANPIALGLLTPPGEFGADIVVGEGQPLGNATNYGGPNLGYMAIKDDRRLLRQLPGRLVGKTEDVEGNTGYVMTMQTREQHIRREKATSNICTNEALNALMAAIYMATMGKEGIGEVANLCYQKTAYLAEKLQNLAGVKVMNGDNYFNEIWLQIEKDNLTAEEVQTQMCERDILAGVNLARLTDNKGLLVCVTEKKTRQELDDYVSNLEVVLDG